MISAEHLSTLAECGITPEFAALRRYETIRDLRRLAELGIVRAGQRTEGLLVPQLRKDGSTWGWQYRPDHPRECKGKTVKYETPWRQRNGIDVPPGVGPMLCDRAVPLWITEGTKKADCGALNGLCIVSLPGVWCWRDKNGAVGDWHDIPLDSRRVILAFDGDVARKQSVRTALRELTKYLSGKGAAVEYLHLPDTDAKTGLDDYLAEHSVEDLRRLVKPTPPPPTQPRNDTRTDRHTTEPKPSPPQPISLEDTHAVFKRWFGDDYDTEALDIMLAVAATDKFNDGSDPVWLLLISGPGAAKTETVQALDGIGAIVTSSITSEAALLSATPRHERAKDATGGLLLRIGDRGLLVIKDVTSILSMDRNMRGRVLSALREIYDGRWTREVGTEGGRSIAWTGRITVVGAVTTAWDTAHAAIATMGDRFALVRIDSTGAGRHAAGRKAIGNTGSEKTMRAELAAAVAGVIAGMSDKPITVTDGETDVLLAAADLVTLARTGVECDYRGGVIDAHAPEMPTRFAKQLTQIVRGAVAIGADRDKALRLAIRCARDSMPPLRLAIINDVAAKPQSTPSDVRRRINKPWTTVDRQLQSLHILGVVDVDEVEDGPLRKSRWYYRLAKGMNPEVLSPDLLLPTPQPPKKTEGEKAGTESSGGTTHKFGEGSKGESNATAACTTCGSELVRRESIERGVCGECRLAEESP